VWLKGKFIGKSPCRIENVAPGETALRITADGYEEWIKSVQMNAGGAQTINAELVRMQGKLDIFSQPAGAAITLWRAGQKVSNLGKSPLLGCKLDIGTYEVRAEYPDQFMATKSVTLANNAQVALDFKLVERPGILVAVSEPADARFFLNGAFQGRTPMTIENLPKGKYNLVIEMPYGTYSQEVQVLPNQTTEVNGTVPHRKRFVITGLLVALSAMALSLVTGI
jgi:hypothetical protein